jgi:hypothetical protein
MKKIICWWSGGATSAVACKVALDMFGKENCRVIMIDTKNEHEDTYRFKTDCEQWYGVSISRIGAFKNVNQDPDYEFVNIGYDYKDIQDVWFTHKSLNVATGAICSTQLKRRVREEWQKLNEYDHQVFGFEFDKKEFNRAKSLSLNHPKAKGIYPLLLLGYDKEHCLQLLADAGIVPPEMYQLGFRNNNCFDTGCVQGGIGYWQKMKRDFPAKFEAMAAVEHQLTALKSSPVTMLKDQSKEAKKSGNVLVFLKKHPEYPNLKSIDEMPECKVEPLFECNGFCGINDLNPRTTSEGDINFQQNE